MEFNIYKYYYTIKRVKSHVVITLSIVLFALLISGCDNFFDPYWKECTTCQYEYYGNLYSSGEVCGTRDEIEQLKADWMDIEYTYSSYYGESIEVSCE